MANPLKFCRSHLQVSVAQICQNLGWNSAHTSPLELLTDVLERYIEELGKVSHRYSEQFGRTEPNLDDLALTFRHMGISVGELEDYVRHVEPVPFAQEVVAFPAPKANNLQFPKAGSREVLHHRAEHIHEHLPPMFPGMEDEVVPETPSTPALGSQPPAQGNASTDVSTPVAAGEKRPAPTSMETPTPGKRPRVTASNLPEEAGHSQYEMTSVVMAPGGFLTPLRGMGRLPDSRTPPPTIRHSLAYADNIPGGGKAVDGSEANKENAAVESASKEPAASTVPAGKESSSTTSGTSNVSSKPENAKSKGKKKDKVPVKDKEKKQKKATNKETEARIKVVVGEKDAISVSVEPGAQPPKKKPKEKVKKKDSVPKPSKTPKVAKVKKKAEPKKKATSSSGPSVSTTSAKDAASDSRLKDLLLSQDKCNLGGTSEAGPSTSSVTPHPRQDLESVPSPNSELMLRQAFPPTDIFESDSHETSPSRLVIAEAEGRAQEREEEKRIRLKNIDETISAVIRKSVTDADNKEKGKQNTTAAKAAGSSKTAASSPKKRGRPKKIKAKDKVKSSEFIAEDVIKKEKEDELGARSAESINDTINAVIGRTHDSQPPAANPNPVAPSDIPSTPTPAKKVKKEGKKKTLDKDKSPGVKNKLKAKLQNKDKGEALPPPVATVEVKPFVSDKFSNAEMKVFEFGEADSPPSLPERRPSQADREPSPSPVVTTAPPPPPVDNSSPVDVKPVIKSPTPETAIAASSASTSSAASVDQPTLQPLKIGIPKEKDKHREKSKDKEHRKEKKEKRREKEKKKKNKDKDRDRDRHEKHHHDHKHDKNKTKEETPPAEGPGLKIKIKLGGVSSSSPSMMSENKAAAEPTVKQETDSPSQRPELKLVIRRDISEGSSSQKKHSSSVPKSSITIKSEPRNTPPTLHPASPLPGTPPPPVLSRNNSPDRDQNGSSPRHSPFSDKFKAERGRSPVHKSPVQESFTFASPQNSPPRSRPSISPVPPTPASFPPKSPSPVPKTPSPRQHGFSGSPMSVSSPPRHSPSAGRKSPTPTPRTPSLSPAYPPTSPFHSDHSPVRREKSPDPIKPLFGTPERESSPPSPLFAAAPVEAEPTEVKPEPPPPVAPKPKGKVGRPRSKSPRVASPKGKSPKGVGKATKSPKAGGTGKSPGRGRPPKAKTLALRAALAAAMGEEQVTPSKPKPPPPPAPEVKSDPVEEEMPALSPTHVEEEKARPDSSSESPSPTSLSIAITPTATSRQRGTVEAETVGSFIDAATGQQIWICPSCKMQDDGSPMIGCDKCDDWYHWVCVNISKEPPEEESWFCPRCSAKAKQVKPKGKRGRKKKVH